MACLASLYAHFLLRIVHSIVAISQGGSRGLYVNVCLEYILLQYLILKRALLK